MKNEPYIDVSQLARNTTLLVETVHTIYEIKVTGPKSCSVLITGGLRFIYETKATLLGCIEDTNKREGTITANCIEKNKSIQFKYKDKKGQHSLITSPVLSAKVTASNKAWYYDVIEKTEEVKKVENSNKA